MLGKRIDLVVYFFKDLFINLLVGLMLGCVIKWVNFVDVLVLNVKY